MQITNRCRRIARLAVLLIALGVASSSFHSLIPAQNEPYRILVTNDDGIDAPGIEALARELRKVGEVIVVAPSRQRSGSSMALTSTQPVSVEEHLKGGVLFGFGVDGTPADAVLLAIGKIIKGKKIDLVVSGINAGPNVGDAAHFSGTVGAAMTAQLLGIPSVAVSMVRSAGADYTFAAQYTARFVAQLKKRGSPKGVVLSINIPAVSPEEVKGVVPARMGGMPFDLTYEERQSQGRTTYVGKLSAPKNIEVGTDSHAFANKMITITPLKFDWTDYELLAELKGWNLTVN